MTARPDFRCSLFKREAFKLPRLISRGLCFQKEAYLKLFWDIRLSFAVSEYLVSVVSLLFKHAIKILIMCRVSSNFLFQNITDNSTAIFEYSNSSKMQQASFSLSRPKNKRRTEKKKKALDGRSSIHQWGAGTAVRDRRQRRG
ncbi:hypothetical protein CDAR_398611 [Caerostris darwini]|uniref:Uncharacterized protein n=1 Tax=Caerostris darwini TaxID=1538125 RepID=A0AAV4VGA5_9ARAC|nr:hypothetical protein CDAR_398611 [Caerostris darwini]